MKRDINELIYASEAELWQVLESTTNVLTRRAAPHALESEAWSAGLAVIMARRNRLALSCEALQVATDVTMQISCAWLAQLRTEFLAVHAQRNALYEATQWRPMDTAPVDRRIMLKRPRWHGGPTATMAVGIGRYEAQPHHKTPRPYWRDDQAFYAVADNRKSEPVGWREIPT